MSKRRRSTSIQLPASRPLSARDLLAIVLVAAFVSLFAPVAAEAVSSVVAIGDTDSTSDVARVDAGKLRVGDGVGAFTVDGSVMPTRHVGAFNAFSFLSASRTDVLIWQSTSRFNLTNLTIMNAGAASRVDLQYNYVDAAALCSTTTLWTTLLRLPMEANTARQFSFPDPTPLGLGPVTGKRVCVRVALAGETTGTDAQVLWSVYSG